MDKHISNLDHFMNVLKLTVLAVVILLVGMFLLGCSQQERHDGDLPSVRSSGGGEYKVTNIEGCQYLAFFTHNGWYTLSHKGNCTNSIHIYRAENK